MMAKSTYAKPDNPGSSSFLCPRCEGKTKVLDSRASAGKPRRRRECVACEFRFMTTEVFVGEDGTRARTRMRLLHDESAAIKRLEQARSVINETIDTIRMLGAQREPSAISVPSVVNSDQEGEQ